MAISPKEIKRRIKGVKNTAQVTKTMEMVAASKMRQAQQAALGTRFYASVALEIMASLSGKNYHLMHPLLTENNNPQRTVLLITSDRGLCGGFNSNLLRTTFAWAKNMQAINFVTVGKKGADAVLRAGFEVVADFPLLMDKIRAEHVSPLAQCLTDLYSENKTGQLSIAYTHFHNTIKQTPILADLLPINLESIISKLETISGQELEKITSPPSGYMFEPDGETVLSSLLSNLVEMQIFQSILESRASEHSARMVAMRNATEASEEIISDLTFAYNRARQEAITAEIAEISSAAEAMKTN